MALNMKEGYHGAKNFNLSAPVGVVDDTAPGKYDNPPAWIRGITCYITRVVESRNLKERVRRGHMCVNRGVASRHVSPVCR